MEPIQSSTSHSKSKPIILVNNPSAQSNKLLNLPSHFKFNHSKLKLKLKSIQSPSPSPKFNEIDQRSLHTAVSQFESNYETAQSQLEHQLTNSSDLNSNSSFNRDIWPILPNRFLYPQSNDLNYQFFYSNSNDNQSTHSSNLHQERLTSDWTTSLGIDLNPNIQHSTHHSSSSSSNSIQPLSSRFKPKQSKFKFNSNQSSKTKSSVYKSCSVYGTYTTLARQEIQKERSLLKKHLIHHHRSSLSLTHLTLHTNQCNHINHNNLIQKSISRPNTSSSNLTHSSASTNRLRKTPTSEFYPISPDQLLHQSKQIIIRKRVNKLDRNQSNPSTKDFSSTFNSNQTNHDTSTFGGKLGVQIRYQNAIANQTHPSNELDSFENSTPEAGPSNWKRNDQIDNHRNRYRTNSDSTDEKLNLSIGKRSTKQSIKTQKQTQLNLTSWEYQVTQQLLIQSQTQTKRNENLSPKSSNYYSLKSTLSFESLPRLSPSLTNLSNRILSSPGSISGSGSGTGPISSPSRVGTMVSLFSDWSRTRQSSPVMFRRRDNDQIESNQDSSLKSSRFKDFLSHQSSLNPLELEFGSNYKETLISIKSDDTQEEDLIKSPKLLKSTKSSTSLKSPKSTFSSFSSKERLQQRSVTQLKREIQQEYFNRNQEEENEQQPNDLTHHDQAGLLVSFLSSSSPSDPGFSPIPSLSPGLNSELEEEEEEDKSSSHSWYDATDQVMILDDSLNLNRIETTTDQFNSSEPNHKHNEFHSRDSQLTKMRLVKPAMNAAIVFDTTHSIERSKNCILSNPLNQYQLLNINPLILPTKTISNSKKLISNHQKTYSTPSINNFNQFKLSLPFPIEKIKSNGIFNPNDDPNFLNEFKLLNHQKKKLEKKSNSIKVRKKRASSDPLGLIDLNLKNENFKNSNLKKKEIDRIEVQEQEVKKFEGFQNWKFQVQRDDDHEDDQEEIIDETELIEFDQSHGKSSNQIDQQQEEQQQIKKVNQRISIQRNQSVSIEIEPIRIQSNSTSSTSTSTTPTTLTVIRNKSFHSFSLVPFNGWCFVFGFIFFPTWYLGSFYPKLIPSTSPERNQFNLRRNSLSLCRISIEHEDLRFLHDQRNGGGGGGPISGWPPRRNTPSTFSGSGSGSGVGSDGLTRISTTEENRIPNFDLYNHDHQNEIEMRTLGGFWNEIVPRNQIQKAFEFDESIWCYERAVHTWRLRCRVMSVLFPLVMIPVLIISEVIVKKM